MFAFFRNRRRRRLLADPFPPAWAAVLDRNVGHYPLLTPAQQARLRDATRVIVAEKEWEGAGGFAVTDEVKVTVAAQAALLLLGTGDHDFYARVPSVVVYPAQFAIPDRDEFGDEDDTFPAEVLDGQAVYRGPVILAWDQVLPEGRDPAGGYNVVIHEFAHQIDYLDNVINGTPPLDDKALAARWRDVMQAAFDAHRAQVERGETETFFSEQATDDETEFFADATEAFFCAPADLRAEEPGVYELLAAYYQLDPVTWFPDAESGRRPDR